MIRYMFIAIALLALVAPTAYLRVKGHAIFRADKKNGTGVYGWLFLFVLLTLYAGPLLGLGVILFTPLELRLSPAGASGFPEYEIYIICAFAAMFAGILLSALAGMVVVLRRPGGRETVKKLLAARVAVEAACYCGLPFLMLPHSMAVSIVNTSVTGILGMAFIQAAWVLYFTRSRQAARTFPA